MAELRDKLSKYIGFLPNEVRLPITEEDRQLFRKLIAEQEEITDIVMDEYQFLIHHGYNFKGTLSPRLMNLTPPRPAKVTPPRSAKVTPPRSAKVMPSRPVKVMPPRPIIGKMAM
ncbi:27749_t:CDS:2, partial [Gigaspora margarita]